MKITFYGQSGFQIETGGKTLVFDPFISPNDHAKHIDVNSIKADYVLLSHGHMDHVVDAELIARNNGATVVSGYEVASWFGKKDLKYHPMNHGGKWTFDFGTVKYVNAVHSSSLPDGSYGGYPGGFVIWNDEGCFYFAGDTALTMDMKLIPMTCPKLDFCILPIGDNFTMGYQDAVIASDFVACDTVIACHYDTFGFIKVDHDKVKAAFAAKGKTLYMPAVGEQIRL